MAEFNRSTAIVVCVNHYQNGIPRLVHILPSLYFIQFRTVIPG
jgi:hypothetical protein